MPNWTFDTTVESWTSTADNGAFSVNDSRYWYGADGDPAPGSLRIDLPDLSGNGTTLYYGACTFYSPVGLGITPTIGNNFSIRYRIQNRAAYTQNFTISNSVPGPGWLNQNVWTTSVPGLSTSAWALLQTTFKLDQVFNSVRWSAVNTTGSTTDGYYSVWIDSVYANENEPIVSSDLQPSTGGIPWLIKEDI